MPSPHHSAAGNGGLYGASLPAEASSAYLECGGRSSDETKQNLAQFLETNLKILGILHQLELTVSSFNVSSQLLSTQRVNVLVTELDTMQKLAENCKIQVPMEVLNLIDDGKNPDEFTRDVINSCIVKNQITKGKTDAFKVLFAKAMSDATLNIVQESLRKYVLEDLEQAFPDEVEAYREIRATSAAESKQLAQS